MSLASPRRMQDGTAPGASGAGLIRLPVKSVEEVVLKRRVLLALTSLEAELTWESGASTARSTRPTSVGTSVETGAPLPTWRRDLATLSTARRPPAPTLSDLDVLCRRLKARVDRLEYAAHAIVGALTAR